MGVRENLRAVAKAYNDFKCAFAPQKNSDDLLAVIKNSLAESLGEYEMVYDYIWGKDSLNIDGETKDYIPQEKDTVIIDISVGKNGEWCDVCRTFFVGEPTKEMEEIFSLIKESVKAGHKELKPNAKASDIYNAVNGVFKKQNKKLVHHAGHRIGDKPLMQPQFLEETQAPIENGLYYTIESGLYDGFGIRLENDFLINENGAEDLFEELLPLNIEEYVLK